jgi:uncharacterized membrane protein
VTSRADREHGSVLVLTIGFVVVVMLFVGVVIDASKLFLTRRALASVADGAATAAAQEVDVQAVYQGGPTAALPLSQAAAAAVAAGSVQQAARAAGLVDVTVDDVTVAGPDVVVTVSGRAVLPLASLVTANPTGVLITVTARARSAVAR